MTNQILKYFLIYMLAINIFAIAVTAYDKHISRLPRGSIRRVSEKTFVRLSLIGGGIGTLFTMLMIRHKTKSHNLLLFKITLLAMLWVTIICYVASKITAL